jgi:hypothetical protein
VGTHTRPSTAPTRFFPVISAPLYEVETDGTPLPPPQRVARWIVQLGNRPLTFWQRYLSWKLEAAAQVGRMLHFHRLALAAELEGLPVRADFFWNELHSALRALWKSPAVWDGALETAARESGAAADCGQIALKCCLVNELFIETHLALFHGHLKDIASPSSRHRAFVHLDWIEQYLPFAELSEEKLRNLLGPLRERHIKAFVEAGQWTAALDLVRRLLQRFPEDFHFQGLVAELEFSRTMTDLKESESRSEVVLDLQPFKTGIARMEAILQAYPFHTDAFDYLGTLHRFHAIQLANKGLLSEALLAVEKALIYKPHPETEQTRTQLSQMMQQLQAEMNELTARIQSSPGATLNAKGAEMQRQAREGFHSARSYHNSKEAESVARDRDDAIALSLWCQIGIKKPADRWQERAALLMQGLAWIIDQRPPGPVQAAELWSRVAVSTDELRSLDSARVTKFLESRLFGTQAPSVLQGAVLVPKERDSRSRNEPFTYWLFSRQGLRLKLQAVAAIVCMIVAMGMTVRDASNRGRRETAWQQLLQSWERRDDLAVLKACEAFFKTSPPPGEDGSRQGRVLEHYRESIVRWVARQDGPLDSEAQTHLYHFRNATQNSTMEGERP